ncbi:hypothetical protein HA402_007186 [Bradysia odoriphaga]|nr:hypothetical protein HA402_007186 [Bradysia odoriphaga]
MASISSIFNFKRKQVKLDQESQLSDFRRNTKLCTEYICDLTKKISKKRVFPNVRPGYLRPLLPTDPPTEPEDFKEMLSDFDKLIIPGTCHWLHPNFYAYFPCGNSFPNILADMLSTSFGGVGFSWTSQPALTELENVMMDWLGRALNLPKFFLFEDSKSVGGGCTTPSGSDSIFCAMVSARQRALFKHGCYKEEKDLIHPGEILPKLVCYTSQESHSSVQKAAFLNLCAMHLLQPNEHRIVTGEILEKRVKEDIANGLIPFFIACCCGSTSGCDFDDFSTIGPVCKKYDIYMHIDGSYGGNSFILPEMRDYMKGIEYADSFNCNPYKLLLGSVDCACLFLKDAAEYRRAFEIDATYLIKEYEDDTEQSSLIDYRHYGVSLSRRMRSLKIWFLFRSYGVSGLQNYIRNLIQCAKVFEDCVRSDHRFEVCNKVILGLVCFRQKENIKIEGGARQERALTTYTDKQNLNLLIRINRSRQLHLVPCTLNGKFVLRFSVNYEFATPELIKAHWKIIQSFYVTTLDKEYLSETDFTVSKEEATIMAFANIVSKEKYESNPSHKHESLPLSFGPIVLPKEDDLSKMLSMENVRMKNVSTQYLRVPEFREGAHVGASTADLRDHAAAYPICDLVTPTEDDDDDK